MRNFQGIIFILIWIYGEIFKSVLVHLLSVKLSNSCFQESVSITVLNKSKPFFYEHQTKVVSVVISICLQMILEKITLHWTQSIFHIFAFLRSHFLLRNVISFITHFRKVLFIIISYIFIHSPHSQHFHPDSLDSHPGSPHSHPYYLHSHPLPRIPLIPFPDSPFPLLQIA